MYSELEYSITLFFIETEFKVKLLILLTLGLGFVIRFISDKEDLYVKRTSNYKRTCM